MTRSCVCLFILALPACARELTAQQVLDRVIAAYSGLKAVHVVAERAETEYELANASGGRYLARLKQPSAEALAVSDGATIWLALSSKKQWSRVSAASQSDDSDEEHDARGASQNLHDALEDMMLRRFLELAKTVRNPVMEKAQDFDLAGQKTRCYTIRAHAGGSEIELLVDRQTFFVLQSAETEVVTRIKLLEVNQEAGDALFHFEPAAGWTEVGTLAPAVQPIKVGERAADFTVKTLDGETVASASLRGSVVVLDFWATWCEPCRVEFPALDKMRTEFGGAARFYGISDESLATVKKFVAENGYQMPMLIDSNREIRRRYGVHKIPALLVIDREGVLRQEFIGEQDESVMRDAIRTVVDRKATER